MSWEEAKTSAMDRRKWKNAVEASSPQGAKRNKVKIINFYIKHGSYYAMQ